MTGYDREKQQTKTRPTTTVRIMSSREFAIGFAHARAGKAFDWKVGSDGKDSDRSAAGRAWDYERGRIFGRLAPRSMRLTINGQLNPAAVALFDDCYRRGYVL
jgi:hypothetical protein